MVEASRRLEGMWQASEKLWVNGLKGTWFLKIYFFPFTGMRCQKNGGKAALFLAPDSSSGPFLEGPLPGGSACPTLTQVFSLSPCLTLLHRKGVPTYGLTALTPTLSLEPTYSTDVACGAAELAQDRISCLASLAGALLHGLAGQPWGPPG